MITYRKGSVIDPVEQGKLMLAHGCNDLGFGSAGVILAIKEQYPIVYDCYESWFKHGSYWYTPSNSTVKARIGEIQIIPVKYIYSAVCNAITQRGIGKDKWGYIPFRYESFRECMCKLNDHMVSNEYERLIIPRIGAGLAGASWETVAKIINKTITVPVTVYDRKEDNWPGTTYED